MRNHGLKVLGLALLSALSMMAFAVAGAQAQLPGESKLGSVTVGGVPATELPATATGTQNGAGSLLVPGRNLKLECKTGHVSEGKINNSTDASGKVTFLECVSLDLEKGTALPCETVGLGTISATALLLPILHGGVNYVLAEPQSGTSFTTVEYKEGTECALPLKNPVTGSITAQTSELEGVSPTLTFSPEIQLLTGDVLRYGGFASYIHANATVKLTGAHEGKVLGIH